MADTEEQPQNTSHGKEWEVVTLTESAYVAAPGSNHMNLNDNEKSSSVKELDSGTSNAMFMSQHFVFPPSQHENLPLEPEKNEIDDEHGGGYVAPQSIEEETGKSETSNREYFYPMHSNVFHECHGIPIYDEYGNIVRVSGTEVEEDAHLGGLNLTDNEQSFFGAGKFSSFENEPVTSDESMTTSESVEFSNQGLDSGFSNLLKHKDKDKNYGANLPCEAWWKKRAASLYTHAKEANAYWSIFVAATVVGLVILGQHWQQERWQVLQLKSQLVINDERIMSRMLGPFSRLKDAIMGGNQRGSFITGSSSTER